MDSASDVHVCNDLKLITDFTEGPTGVGRSIAEGVSPRRGTFRIRMALKDGSERFILNFWNVFHLPNSPSNLVSSGFHNDAGVYYNTNVMPYRTKSVENLLLFPNFGKKTSSYIYSTSLSQPTTSWKPKTISTKMLSQKYIKHRVTNFHSQSGINDLDISTSRL